MEDMIEKNSQTKNFLFPCRNNQIAAKIKLNILKKCISLSLVVLNCLSLIENNTKFMQENALHFFLEIKV